MTAIATPSPIDELRELAERFLGDPKLHSAPRVEVSLHPLPPRGFEVSISLCTARSEEPVPGFRVAANEYRTQTWISSQSRRSRAVRMSVGTEEVAAAILTLVRAVGDIEEPAHPLAFFTPPRAA